MGYEGFRIYLFIVYIYGLFFFIYNIILISWLILVKEERFFFYRFSFNIKNVVKVEVIFWKFS